MRDNKQFKEWLSVLRKHPTDRAFSNCELSLHMKGYDFEDWSLSMQWGVYLEFFDSVGIYIDMNWSQFMNKPLQFSSFVNHNVVGYYLTRQEAQQAAITKAFELLSYINN
tara:strand:- start:458 stop:787 length:330 start_codon:yes stop_codon:yes gene_type:complete